MLDADDALGRHEWLIAPLLLQGSASPDARILLALPLDVNARWRSAPGWRSVPIPSNGMKRRGR